MAVDLLAVGEELAELDLVVRQLDDGSLTVAKEDNLPDDARVRISSGPDGGLLATLGVGPSTATTDRDLPAAQAALGRGRLVVGGGQVRLESSLPPPPDGRYGRDALRQLFDEVLRGTTAARGRLATGTAPAGKEADPNAPTEFLLIEAPPGAPAVPVAKPVAAALPGSYLRGAGQQSAPTVTERYGAIGQVPGRAELSPEDRRRRDEPRRNSARQPQVQQGGGGGAGVVLALLGLIGVGAIAAGVFFTSRMRRSTLPPPVAPVAPPGPGFRPGQPAGTSPGDPAQPPVTPTTPTSPAPPVRRPEPRPEPEPPTEAQLLEQVKSPATRAGALEQWSSFRLDRADGARLRMLQALGPDAEADPKASRALVQSLRATPPPAAEAIACLPLAQGNVRRALIPRLGELGPGPDADRAATALAALGADTQDLLVDEALVRLGHPKDGAALRLATARGKEWALWGDGQPLLEALSKRGVKNVAGLLEHSDPEVRAMACALIGRAEQPQEALPLLAGRFGDESPEVKLRAIEGIVLGNDAHAAPALARGLAREPQGQVRDALRDALSRLPTRETVAQLITLFERPDVADRRAAVVAADAMGKVEGVPLMTRGLEDADRAVRLDALRALEKAHRAPALRPKVSEALAAIRRIGLDRSDRELSNIARNLHLAIAGRLPEDSVRSR